MNDIDLSLLSHDLDVLDFSLESLGTMYIGRPVPEKRKWAAALHFTLCAKHALGHAVVFGASVLGLAKLPLKVMFSEQDVFGGGVMALSDHSFLDHNQSKQETVHEDRSLRSAYDSSVVLVAFDRQGNALFTGAGTIIENTSVWGHPALVTVRHMTMAPEFNEGGSFLVAFDHSGGYLGAVRPALKHSLLAAHLGDDDAPVLLAFDRRLPIDEQRLLEIPGVMVASVVGENQQVAIFEGKGAGELWTSPGNSGAGVFVYEGGRYKLAAVVTQMIQFRIGELTPEMPNGFLPAQFIGNPETHADKIESEKTMTILSPLGQNGFISILRNEAHYKPFVATSAYLTSGDIVGSWFGKYVPSFFKGYTLNNWASGNYVRTSATASVRNLLDATKKLTLQFEVQQDQGQIEPNQEPLMTVGLSIRG